MRGPEVLSAMASLLESMKMSCITQVGALMTRSEPPMQNQMALQSWFLCPHYSKRMPLGFLFNKSSVSEHVILLARLKKRHKPKKLAKSLSNLSPNFSYRNHKRISPHSQELVNSVAFCFSDFADPRQIAYEGFFIRITRNGLTNIQILQKPGAEVRSKDLIYPVFCSASTHLLLTP